MDLEKLFLEENVGGWDLFLRALFGAVGVVFLALGFFDAPVNYFVGLISFIGLFSAVTRHCTPYAVLGFSTRKK